LGPVGWSDDDKMLSAFEIGPPPRDVVAGGLKRRPGDIDVVSSA